MDIASYFGLTTKNGSKLMSVLTLADSIIGSFKNPLILECECCSVKNTTVIRYHQRTLYHHKGQEGDENDPNFVTLCPDCKTQNDEYWDGMWADYYSGCL